MSFKLIMIKGPGAPRPLPIREDVTFIGRREDCQIRIVSSEVSRQHCQLIVKGGHLYVIDLKSSNGTFVNGLRIQAPTMLSPGDTLVIGPLVFQVAVMADTSTSAAPAASPAKAGPGDTAPGMAAPVPSPAAPAPVPVSAVSPESAPASAKSAEDDAFDMLFDDTPAEKTPAQAAPAPTTSRPSKLIPEPAAAPTPPAAAKSADEDEFVLDLGLGEINDTARTTTLPEQRPASPRASNEASPAAQPPPPPTPAEPESSGTDVDDAVADFLSGLKIDDKRTCFQSAIYQSLLPSS